jgi:hypothetical protein
MASAQTNSTIWTIAFVGAGGFIIWKLFGKGTKTASAGVGAAGGYPNYYAPQQQQPQGGSPQLSIGGGGGSNPGKSGGGAPPPTGVDATNPANSPDWVDAMASALRDGIDAFTGDYMGSESDPEFGGDSLLTTTGDYGLDDTLPSSVWTIPYEDAGQMVNLTGTNFVTSGNDGSANAVSAQDGADAAAAATGDSAAYGGGYDDGSDDGGDDDGSGE